MRRVALVLTSAMALVCGAYTIIYLVRWEWNRAIIAGLFFVAVELIVCSAILIERLNRLDRRLGALGERAPAASPPTASNAPTGPDAPDAPVTSATPVSPVSSASSARLDAIRDAAPAPRDHFVWLREQTSQTNVFLPVLLGAGVFASVLAWAVESIARATISPVRERRLAERLGVLSPPPGGLTGPPPAELPAGSGSRGPGFGRVAAAVVAFAVAGVATAGAIDFVADRTQTRPDTPVAGVDTVIELELRGALAARDPERVLEHLWSVCTGPDVFRSRTVPEPEVSHTAAGRVHLRIDTDVGDHGMDRLRGCLNDATLDKVQADVVRTATVSGL